MNQLKFIIPSLLAVLLSLNVFLSCNRQTITFAKDVAPIIHKNCTPCHQPSGAAPFSLIYYQQIKKKAKMIAHVTASKYMPPWPADISYSRFVNERYLTSAEIKILQLWYKQGAKSGDTSTLKLPTNLFNQASLGKPDLIIDVPSVDIKNNNLDQFYTIKIPYQNKERKYVRAIEFVPGKIKYVHHFNGHYLAFNETTNPFVGKRIANLSDSNYLNDFNELKLQNADGSFPFRVHSAVNYLPGAFGIKYPEGIGGLVLEKNGAFIANDLHYGPSTKNITDNSKLFLYFSKTAPQRPTYELMLGTNGVSKIEPPLIIPPNKITTHRTSIMVYNDISILTINPHLHLLGKQFWAFAVKPNGDTIPLIKINKWEFRWQYFYTFKKAVKIPKGSSIIVIATFDNTSKNPNNPNKPPKVVAERFDKGGASMRTTDEMFQFIITYLPYQKGDENISLE